MPFWGLQDLQFDVDAVLRGQGADPVAIRERSPRLAEIAERALEEARPLLKPKTIYRRLGMKELLHERLRLENGYTLSGPLVAEHLGPSDYIVAILCTIGSELERYATKVSAKDMVFGLALDGVGSAAVEALANAACSHFEDLAQSEGYQSSIPISPGMLGWPVDQGQPELFDILDASQIGVTITSYSLMIPRKSLTMVLGFGPDMQTSGKTCDYCAIRETCRYQAHYEHAKV